jgi:anti-sigma regulatory factor (Ser/Thr protein kinase)
MRPSARVVPHARLAVAEALLGAGLAEWPATLLVSELAANAVDHARTEFEVRVTLGPRLRIEVRDASRIAPAMHLVDAESERGRGLQLIDRVALDWGVQLRPAGKTVWFELDPVPAP